MRFDPGIFGQDLKKTFVLVPLIMVGIVASGTHVQAQDVQAPLIKGAPKINMDWADTQKPRRMNFSQLRKRLKPADEFATLYALQVALSRVGDGQTYVWSRPKRKLRAFITPVNSFRASNGTICRKIIVSLALGSYLKRTKTTACRASDRSWTLQG